MLPKMGSSPVLLLYLIAIVWAVMGSGKRWATLFCILATVVAVIGALWIASLIWPYGGGVLGHLVLPIGLLLAAVVGIGHMRTHRRVSKP